MELLKSLTLFDVVTAVVDIGVASYVFYRLFMLVRGTRAVQLIRGIIFLVAALFVSQWLHLREVNWLLKRAMEVLIVAIPVVFQPELRRFLEQLGRGRLFPHGAESLDEESRTRLINELVRAAEGLARNRTGALIVLERATGLNDYSETGIRVEGLVTAELLSNLFVPSTPLHDGAVIVRGDRIVAAGCFLPLAEPVEGMGKLGSRHRAALGISEQSDAVALVVSEETGQISIAQGGKLVRNLDGQALRNLLQSLIGSRGAASPLQMLFSRNAS